MKRAATMPSTAEGEVSMADMRMLYHFHPSSRRFLRHGRPPTSPGDDVGANTVRTRTVGRRAGVSRTNFAARVAAVTLLALCLTPKLSAQTTQDIPDVTSITLEDLMNLEVTSVSKRAQKLGDAAAAIFVITQEDIRRSGATSIPEALRMAPGIEVARINENTWAIGSRGFNGRFDNKLLVLIDGRSVYTPLFSGVYWNVQDVMLEDVDRIEVIRGPGATLWGANAVDGVINIITKPAVATQGLLATAEAGTEERTSESVRYGGKIGDKTYYRAYAKYFDWGPSKYPSGLSAYDGWDASRGGFRVDSKATSRDSFTLQGDLYENNYNETLTIPTLAVPYTNTFNTSGGYRGGDILGRWDHAFARSSTSLQMYYDNTNVSDPSLFTDHQGIYDVDFQHDLHVGESQEFVWGLGYRSIQDQNSSSFTVSLQPNHSNLNLYSGFVQDEVTFFQKRLSITLGTKLEHNDFTGFEVEPNARVLYNLTKKQAVWAAVSRAVRTPALTEEGLQLNEQVIPPGTPPLNSPLPGMVSIFGSPRFFSEDLLAYELGYRIQATSTVSADIAAFYNDYSNLRSAEPGVPFVEGSPTPTDVVVPLVAENKMGGGTYGIELFGEWKIRPMLRVQGSYSYLQMDIHKNAGSLDPTADNPSGASPRNQFYIRSSMDLPHHLQHDVTLRYVDQLPALNIPSYYSLDTHLGWHPVTTFEIYFTGQNLLNDKHLEFIPELINTVPTQVTRTLSVGVRWTF